MKSKRNLNGYVVIYKPEHKKAMTSENWKGYVYEHIVVAEEDYKREILDYEEIHHLDRNRSNNSPNNLVIVCKRTHGKIHKWLEGSDKGLQGKCLRCTICDKPLKLKQKLTCSTNCKKLKELSKLNKISFEEIIKNLKVTSMSAYAKTLGVSDNGLRKHIFKKYNLDKDSLKISTR